MEPASGIDDTTTPAPTRSSAYNFASYAAIAYLALAVIVGLGDIAFILRNFAKLPFGDHWIWLAVLYETGPLKVLGRQFNEHRLTVPGLAYLADHHWFGGTNTFLIAVSMLTQVGCIGFLTAPLWRVHSILKPILHVFSGFVIITMLWFIQGANFFYPFSLCLACANLGILVALNLFSLLTTHNIHKHETWAIAGIAFFGFWASYSYGHGMLIWPALLVMCLVLRQPARHFAVIGAASLMAMLIYFIHYTLPANHANPFASLRHPLRVARYIVLMIGLPFFGNDAQDASFANHVGGYVITIAGIGLAVALLVRLALTRREQKNSEHVFYCSLILLCLGSAFITALNRSSFPVEQALSGRYAPIPLLFWISLIALTTVYLSRLEVPGGLGRAIWCGLLMIASLVTLSTQVSIGRYFAFRERIQAAAAMSITVGAPDLPLVESELQLMWRVVFFVDQREQVTMGRSYFARPEKAWLGTPLRQHFQTAAPGTCVGSVDSVTPISEPSPGGAKLMGWAWNKSEERPAERIWITDDQMTIRGLGITHIRRADVASAFGRSDMDSTGWIAYSQPGQNSGSLAVFADSGSGKALCQIGTFRTPAP